VLEAVRGLDYSPAVVVVTTDKVYRNTGQDIAYPEDAQLGGLDPYGASKSCVELIADCYRHTYRLNVVTARCANVIGGGDWGAYRLVPQCIEAFTAGRPVVAHDATRVWMHVLDACRGYAMLAELMVTGKCRETDPEWCDWEATYNFGPNNPTPVIKVALKVAGAWGNASVETSGCEPSRESAYLDIDSLRAWVDLGWTPRWSLDHTIRRTVEWHRAHLDGADMELVSTEQLNEYKRDVVRLAA
jgi:CDP-glucose 4,6-dehydratase